MNTLRIARAGALAALWLATCAAHAIEAPKPQPAPEKPAEQPPPELTVTPTDERAFYEKVQRVTAYRSMRGLKIPPEVIAELGRGNADAAVATLSRLAVEGNKEADIALVHVQHWCNSVTSQRAGDPKVQMAKLLKGQPEQRAARVAGVMYAEVEYMQRARARQTRSDAAERGEKELPAGRLQGGHQSADGCAARADHRERRSDPRAAQDRRTHDPAGEAGPC